MSLLIPASQVFDLSPHMPPGWSARPPGSAMPLPTRSEARPWSAAPWPSAQEPLHEPTVPHIARDVQRRVQTICGGLAGSRTYR